MKYCRQMRSANTGAWEYDLLAAVIQRAMLDAQGKGQRAAQAQRWLDDICPRWRKMTAQKGLESTKTGNGYIDAHQTTNVESGPSGRVTTGS